MTNKLLHHPLSHLLVILVPGVLIYANTFGVPFVFDDLEALLDNEIIRDLGNFLPGGSGYGYSRRWIGMLSFALNYRFGGLAIFGYHLINLAVHLGTALLVYTLVRLTFLTPRLATSRLAPQAAMAALLAALFFTVHPIQTQAVTYIVQRLTSLCTFFYLLSLVLYVWGRLHLEDHGSRITDHGLVFPLHYILFATSVLAAVLAMFTKEIAFTLPLAALLYEASFFQGPWRRRALILLPLLLTLPLIPLGVLSEGLLTAEGTLQQTRVAIPRLDYLLTQFPVIVTYLRLLILPINQNLDYDYPIYTTFFTPPVILAFLLLAAIMGLAVYLLWRTRARLATTSDHGSQITDHGSRITDQESHHPPLSPHSSRLAEDPSLRLIAFGLLWFFLTISIESGLVPLADVIFEHRLYLPSVGLAAALGVTVLLAVQRTSSLVGGRLPLIAAALALVALGVATWQRNKVWQNELTLWGDVALKSPAKTRPLYNLGTYLKDGGRPEEAIAPLMQAVRLDPQYAEAWHNLGLAYLMTGQPAVAVEPLRRAVQIKPEMDNATVNLSAALLKSGQAGEAVVLLERNLYRFPAWAEARLNLGTAYVGVGNLPAARRELAVLQRLNPDLARRLADRIRRASATPP